MFFLLLRLLESIVPSLILQFPQPGVESVCPDKLVMGSFLCDPSVFKNKDLLCAAHGFQPMGDHDYGAFFGYFVQRLLHSRPDQTGRNEL